MESTVVHWSIVVDSRQYSLLQPWYTISPNRAGKFPTDMQYLCGIRMVSASWCSDFQYGKWVDFCQERVLACWLVAWTAGTRGASLPGDAVAWQEQRESWWSTEKLGNRLQVVSLTPTGLPVRGCSLIFCIFKWGLQGKRTVLNYPMIITWFWKPNPVRIGQEAMAISGGGTYSSPQIRSFFKENSGQAKTHHILAACPWPLIR